MAKLKVEEEETKDTASDQSSQGKTMSTQPEDQSQLAYTKYTYEETKEIKITITETDFKNLDELEDDEVSEDYEGIMTKTIREKPIFSNPSALCKDK